MFSPYFHAISFKSKKHKAEEGSAKSICGHCEGKEPQETENPKKVLSGGRGREERESKRRDEPYKEQNIKIDELKEMS